MSAEVVASIATAFVALVVAVVSAVVSTRSARDIARMQLEQELQRRKLDQDQLVEEVMGRYREPLLRAAFDLQSRLYNLLRQRLLERFHQDGTGEEREYVEVSTMFVYGEYLGWAEILRRGVQFLDLGDAGTNRQLAERLDAVNNVLLSSWGELRSRDFRIFRGQQRALGELMIRGAAIEPGSADGGRALECIGYAAFAAKLEEDERFARWFDPLRESTRRLAAGDGAGHVRLRELQHSLIDLIDLLDPEHVRFPARVRRRL